MSLTKEEMLELFYAAGGKYINLGTEPEADVMRFQCRHEELLAHTSAIEQKVEQKYQAQIAMLREVLDIASNGIQWYIDNSEDADESDDEMLTKIVSALAATQATAEAFRAEVEARALEEAASVAYAWPDDQHAELELRCMAAEKRKQAEQLTNKEKEA